jgi:hypothetical protein
MPAQTLNLNIEKGVDFSASFVLQRSGGHYVDLSDTGICVKAEIVEFYGLAPITGFTIQENLPSGVTLSLNEQGSSILPFDKSYYDIVLNTSGNTERFFMGEIALSQNATINTSCM